MKTILVRSLAAASALVAISAGAAHAGNVSFGLGFYSPAPVYYEPYYAPRPQPVYYAPSYRYTYYQPYYGYGYRSGYRDHDRRRWDHNNHRGHDHHRGGRGWN